MREQLEALVKEWHEAGRAAWNYKNLDYDKDEEKTIKEKRKYFYLDIGTSGAWIVDKTSGLIYKIKSCYGVPNPKKCLGHVNEVSGLKLHQLRWW